MIFRGRTIQSIEGHPLSPVDISLTHRDHHYSRHHITRDEMLYVLDSTKGPLSITLKGDELEEVLKVQRVCKDLPDADNGLLITCMTSRFSESMRAPCLYVGTNQGVCHVINALRGHIVSSIKVFPKRASIRQLVYLRDEHSHPFYLVASQEYKRKVAIIHESSQDRPVTHYKFNGKVVRIGVNLNYHLDQKYEDHN